MSCIKCFECSSTSRKAPYKITPFTKCAKRHFFPSFFHLTHSLRDIFVFSDSLSGFHSQQFRLQQEIFVSGQSCCRHLCLSCCVTFKLPSGRVPVFYIRCQPTIFYFFFKCQDFFPSRVSTLCRGHFFPPPVFPVLCTK